MSLNVLLALVSVILCAVSGVAARLAVRSEVRAQSARRETQRLGDRVAEVAAAIGTNDPKRLNDARVELDNVLPYHAGPYRSLEMATIETPSSVDPKPTLAAYLRYKNALEAVSTLNQDTTAQRIARQALGEKWS